MELQTDLFSPATALHEGSPFNLQTLPSPNLGECLPSLLPIHLLLPGPPAYGNGG